MLRDPDSHTAVMTRSAKYENRTAVVLSDGASRRRSRKAGLYLLSARLANDILVTAQSAVSGGFLSVSENHNHLHPSFRTYRFIRLPFSRRRSICGDHIGRFSIGFVSLCKRSQAYSGCSLYWAGPRNAGTSKLLKMCRMHTSVNTVILSRDSAASITALGG